MCSWGWTNDIAGCGSTENWEECIQTDEVDWEPTLLGHGAGMPSGGA